MLHATVLNNIERNVESVWTGLKSRDFEITQVHSQKRTLCIGPGVMFVQEVVTPSGYGVMVTVQQA